MIEVTKDKTKDSSGLRTDRGDVGDQEREEERGTPR